MKKQDIREKAADLLKQNLSPGEEAEIIKALEEEGVTAEEIQSLKNLGKEIEDSFSHEPSEGLDSRFYSMLDNESTKPVWLEDDNKKPILKNSTLWFSIAAGIALFILGWFSASLTGSATFCKEQLTGLSDELKDIKETLVLTMLDQNSASQRIKAVNMIKELDTSSGKIIENLFKALNTDENDNVRLLALEALIKYADNSEVREGLVSSISKQTSPMIQLRMTEIMTALNEKSSVAEFRRLLDNASLNYSVRTRIQEAVGTLL